MNNIQKRYKDYQETKLHLEDKAERLCGKKHNIEEKGGRMMEFDLREVKREMDSNYTTLKVVCGKLQAMEFMARELNIKLIAE